MAVVSTICCVSSFTWREDGDWKWLSLPSIVKINAYLLLCDLLQFIFALNKKFLFVQQSLIMFVQNNPLFVTNY